MLVGAPLGFFGGTIQIIQSIQQVQITIASATTATATISAVNTSNTALFWNGFTSNTNAPQILDSTTRITLTDSTTVTATRTGNSSASQTMYVTVVEFKSAYIQSIQYGSAAVATGTATISSVNTSNAFVIYNGYQRGGTSTTMTARNGTCTLTNSTTVTVTADLSDNGATVYFCVVEFKAGVLAQAAQPFSISITSAASNTATITSADTNNSMIVWGGTAIGGTTYADFFPRLDLTNATTVTGTRVSTSATTTVVKGTVLTFATGVLRSVQRGTATITTGGATATATISSVTTTKTLVGFLGHVSAQANSNMTQIQAGSSLTNATTVTVAVNTTPSANNVVGYEAVEFN